MTASPSNDYPSLPACLIRLAGMIVILYALSLLFSDTAFRHWQLLSVGLLLGFFYVASLIVKNYIFLGRFKSLISSNMALFFLFSLLRVAFFGYAFYRFAGGDSQRLLLVFTGFLGYSSWVFLEYMVNAFRLKNSA